MKRFIVAEIIIWAVLLTVIFLVGIFAYSKLFVEPNVYKISFKDIDGITKGSPVRLMGINVGHVRKLAQHDKHIDVQVIITKKDVKIPNGTIAKVEFFGLGGSKSVELMPPDGSCNVGIISGDTIRIADVAHEAVNFVGFIETIERYIKSIDETSMEKFLDGLAKIKDDGLQKVGTQMNDIKEDVSKKAQDIIEQEKDFSFKVQDMGEVIDKLNKFIKK